MMKKIGFYTHEKIFLNNRFFTMIDCPLGDDMLYPNRLLAEYARSRGVEVMTVDMDDLDAFDAVVFIEMPAANNRYFQALRARNFKEMYLAIYECPMVKPDNWNIEGHRVFKKIFTWNDDLVDGQRYLKMNWTHRIPRPDELTVDLGQKTKFCTMITSHKRLSHPQELYSERIRAIRWFEQHHPEEFDLYGIGWDRFYFQPPLRKLNRIKPLTRLLDPHFSSYRGPVKCKRDVLRQYRFAICYENQRDVPGYITEKIFDCFFAGCVPVYWGANNIDRHIPKETFIDRREFGSHEELYRFLKNMPDRDFEHYLTAIKNYLGSNRVEQFTADYYARTVIDHIFPKTGLDGN